MRLTPTPDTGEDERGMTMITTLVVIMIAAALGVTSMTVADHAITRSAKERDRSAALHAAEAGLHSALVALSGSGGSTWCGQSAGPVTVLPVDAGTPGGQQWEATVSDSAGVTGTCAASDPIRVIRANGWSPAYGALGASVRTLEAEVTLVPAGAVAGGGFGFPATVFSASPIVAPTLAASVSVLGDGAGGDGDLVSGASVPLTVGAAIQGSIEAQGAVTLGGAAHVGSVRATGALSGNGSALVDGAVTSATGPVTLSGSAHVSGDATAADAITADIGAIGGVRRADAPTSPPPAQALPAFSFSAGDPGWPAPMSTWSTCSAFASYIASHLGGLRGTHRITQNCTLDLSSALIPSALVVDGNLAIVTDGTIRIRDRVVMRRSGGSATALLISLHQATSGADTTGVSIEDSATFRNLAMFQFARNQITKSAPGPLTGQCYADRIVLSGSGSLTTRIFSPPGFSFASGSGALPGFNPRVSVVREVAP